MGCFVHGLDGDTRGCFDETLEFVLKARIDLPRFTICTPFPGTPYFDKLKAQGRILTEQWSLYDAQHVVFRPEGMSVDELRSGHHEIWKEAYRFRHVVDRLAYNRCFLSYATLANIGYALYALNLPKYSESFMQHDHMIDQVVR
jgi:radical SAM superfamily enzyme YgiQ (UPF0313 family)